MAVLQTMLAVACAAAVAAAARPILSSDQDTDAARPVGVSADDQVGQPGGVYVMPRGDYAGEPSRTLQEAPAPRSPIPQDELLRLKRSGAGGQAPTEDSLRPVPVVPPDGEP
jgi:hypothetical protein